MVENRDKKNEAAQISDFAIRKYELDRQHELELNKFTHALEMERLKLLLVLNGGAIGLWLGFIEPGEVGDSIAGQIFSIIAPVFCWIIGIVLASFTYDKALAAQRGFTQAYHRRRRADEWQFMSVTHSREELATMMPDLGGLAEDGDSTPDQYRRLADEAIEHGFKASKQRQATTRYSIFAFALGAIAVIVISVHSLL